MEGIEIVPEEKGFCKARCYPVVVAEKIEGAVVVPEVSGYPDSKMEIIAPCNIRETLGVTDGDMVKVGIVVEKVRSSLLKERHIKCCLEKNVESSLTTGFERYYLVNQSLPGIAFEDIDTSSSFLGKKISTPFIISPMTGGTDVSTKVNKNLAKAAQELGIVMSVGSQRLALEDPSLIPTYQVRDVAPDIPLLANLGAIYLNYGYGPEECKRAVEMIGADGLVLYLNPLQKRLQGGFNSDFKNLVKKISQVCKELDVPVIVKEVGFGLSSSAGVMLREAGVWGLDVAGAGGTSWAKIERCMNEEEDNLHQVGNAFDNWGIPTADSLVFILEVINDIPIIASGGIRNGVEMAKAIALGASYVGMALPLLAPAMESHEAVKEKIQSLIDEFKTAMFCCAKKDLDDLRKGDCIKKINALEDKR
jgi:isopentenyl-diphosphate delta-isomerase